MPDLDTTPLPSQLDTSIFAEGDLEPELLASVVNDSQSLFGKWEILRDRSESHDAIMCALGVPFMKRTVMKNTTPVTHISDGGRAGGHPCVKLVTHLGLNVKKHAEILTDATPFEINDGDTGEWVTTATVCDGRLLQRRVNKATQSVMYDTRAVFEKDPMGKCSDSPMMVFKWTVVDGKTSKKLSCLRWMKKIE